MTKQSESLKPKTAGEMVKLAREFLLKKGIEEARLEAELLVAHALSLDRLRLFLAYERPVTQQEIELARTLLVRRGKREPAAYVIGKREFYGRSFAVGAGVLVPRPETELIVDRARELARARAATEAPFTRAADLGTGSGCLAVTLALEIEGLHVLAVDSSADALAWARRNVDALGASARVELATGDGFDVLRARVARDGPFDLLVSNPPYVDLDDEATLAPEVRAHEPHDALFAPRGDSDHFARRLLELRGELVASGGTLLIELGHRQAPRLRAWCEASGITARFVKDYEGHERVLEVRLPSG